MTLSSQAELLLSLLTLNTRIQKRLLGPLSLHGISFTEYQVLRQLSLAPGNKLRRIDLANDIGLSASGITRLLAPMEKIGLVVKEDTERDARVSLVALTASGERIVNDAHVSFTQTADAILAPLSRTKQLELAALVTHILT